MCLIEFSEVPNFLGAHVREIKAELFSTLDLGLIVVNRLIVKSEKCRALLVSESLVKDIDLMQGGYKLHHVQSFLD